MNIYCIFFLTTLLIWKQNRPIVLVEITALSNDKIRKRTLFTQNDYLCFLQHAVSTLLYPTQGNHFENENNCIRRMLKQLVGTQLCHERQQL